MSGRREFRGGGRQQRQDEEEEEEVGEAIRGRVSIKANQEGVGKVYRSGSSRKMEEEVEEQGEEEETEEMRIDKEMGRS